MGKNRMTVFQFNLEHRVRQRFDYGTFNFNYIVRRHQSCLPSISNKGLNHRAAEVAFKASFNICPDCMSDVRKTSVTLRFPLVSPRLLLWKIASEKTQTTGLPLVRSIFATRFRTPFTLYSPRRIFAFRRS